MQDRCKPKLKASYCRVNNLNTIENRDSLLNTRYNTNGKSKSNIEKGSKIPSTKRAQRREIQKSQRKKTTELNALRPKPEFYKVVVFKSNIASNT